jgi:DNA-directed RNA polymerase subunit omega
MNSQILEEASKRVENAPVLINMISKRVRQLNAGSRPMVAVRPGMGLSDVALSEVAAGKLRVPQYPTSPAAVD